MATISKSPSFKGLGGVTSKDDSIKKKTDAGVKSSWYIRLFGNYFVRKITKILLVFIVSYFVLWLANYFWFDHHSMSANPEWDFWAKTLCIFGSAAGLLIVADEVFQTRGRATSLAFTLLFCVTVAQHYFAAPYYENGKPTFYVNSRTGDIYQNALAKINHDARTNRNYFLHPRSNDTCWNDIPANVEMASPVLAENPGYNPPSRIKSYGVGTYTFNLKAGETLSHWIIVERGGIHLDFESDNFDYWIIYSETEQYHDSPDLIIPDRGVEKAKFYLKAGKTDQVIKIKLSYQ